MAVAPAATVVPFIPPFQVMRVIALAFGSVAAGPMPVPVMFSASVGEAVTLIVISTAALLISPTGMPCRKLTVAESVAEVPRLGR